MARLLDTDIKSSIDLRKEYFVVDWRIVSGKLSKLAVGEELNYAPYFEPIQNYFTHLTSVLPIELTMAGVRRISSIDCK